MKIISWFIGMLLLGSAVSGQTSDVARSYDRFKDETSIKITVADAPMDSNFNSATWTLSTTFAGETLPVKPQMTLSLTVSGKDWQLLQRDLTLRAFIGNERATIELASLVIPLDLVRKIGNSNKFEVQLASIEMSFTRDQRNNFTTFARVFEK